MRKISMEETYLSLLPLLRVEVLLLEFPPGALVMKVGVEMAAPRTIPISESTNTIIMML